MTSPDKPRAPVTQELELLPCWTCRHRTFADITHSSQEFGWPLYRCVNCKAVYPELALRPPPVPTGDVKEQARELLAAETGLSADPNCPDELTLEDKDQVFVEDALRTVERALSSPIPPRDENGPLQPEVRERIAREASDLVFNSFSFETLTGPENLRVRLHMAAQEAISRILGSAFAGGGVNDDPDLGQIERGHVCKHGIRWPHPCQPCDDAAWQLHLAKTAPAQPRGSRFRIEAMNDGRIAVVECSEWSGFLDENLCYIAPGQTDVMMAAAHRIVAALSPPQPSEPASVSDRFQTTRPSEAVRDEELSAIRASGYEYAQGKDDGLEEAAAVAHRYGMRHSGEGGDLGSDTACKIERDILALKSTGKGAGDAD